MSTTSPDGLDPVHRRVELGDVVGYRYVIRSDTGQVLAVSAEIVHYLHGGNGTLPRALSSRIEGRHDGETFTATLAPNEGFGSRDGARRMTLPRERFPDLLALAPGTRVQTATPDGHALSVWVVDSSESDVVVDFDHPLAGRTLHFEVSIMSIRGATAGEMEEGQPSPPERREPTLSLATPPVEPHASPAVDPAVHQQLVDLRALLEQRFKDEERRGGPLDEPVAGGSANESEVQGFRLTHESLLGQLDAIVAGLKLDDDGYDHREALATLVAALERHDGAESDAPQDSTHTDVGGEE
jgi:FKBP-type peptidyl-prolyl cis-trans isomerase SlyD